MSTINEQIVTGRAHRVLIDKVAKLWQRISFWTKASDVEFNDGNTAETKVGAIKGITTDLNTTETGYAADMTALAQLNSDKLNSLSERTVLGDVEREAAYRLKSLAELDITAEDAISLSVVYGGGYSSADIGKIGSVKKFVSLEKNTSFLVRIKI